MTERETARRVFAREFNDSTLQTGDHTDRSPNFIVTPTGVMCNRVFAAGVLTEVENIGTEGQLLYRARLADPTGVYTIYAGQYQPSAALFLSRINTPAYVAVVGKARIFNPEPGASYISVRPEEINLVDENIRNRWIYHTARLSLEKIEVMRKALATGLRGAELARHMMPVTNDAEGISRAIDHYSVTSNTLDAYKQMVANALSTVIDTMPLVKDETGDSIAPDEAALQDMLTEAIVSLDSGEGASYEAVLSEMSKLGYSGEDVEKRIISMMENGQCYEPRIGIIRIIG